ncbi:T9SS type A sorting domain-containing protein [uncultured Lacinutrix sp.]|uniref:T9SS type A sorting domain-containing protein n=1 Tax=uncultured Lacinutrix sp. TaxID=574032 RepID=UPI002628A2C2|nr:T9SS type A sorting domain-containing protein [uncultured Lacinutrix sp.]
MKTKLLYLAAFFAAFFQLANAQCSRSGTFIQSDPAYSISGTGNITFETNGNKNVIFESDFETVQGADLRVYLSKFDNIEATGSDALEVSTQQLMNDGGGTGGPGVSPITGMMTFSIPPSVTLEEFDYIVIQCITINERWGHVSLNTPSGPDCGTLSVDENELLNNVSFYPNPTNNQIEISNPKQLSLDISLYNVLGKKVLEANTVSLRNQTLNLSSLNSGVYLVEIKAEGKSITKKLIKQ